MKERVSQLKTGERARRGEKSLEHQLQQLLVEVPNAPHYGVPKGKTAEDNKIDAQEEKCHSFPKDWNPYLTGN